MPASSGVPRHLNTHKTVDFRTWVFVYRLQPFHYVMHAYETKTEAGREVNERRVLVMPRKRIWNDKSGHNIAESAPESLGS